MRIGFTNIYAWRPHVEHMQYLALLSQQGGHEARYLACDADLPACYSRMLRPQSPSAWECIKCRAGSTRSYAPASITSGIGELLEDAPPPHPPVDAKAWTQSSANTLWRFESPAEFDSPQAHDTMRRLGPAVERTFTATLRWIERERLDGIVVFNGRMDVTRAATGAAVHAGIPYVSLERSWFGDGLQLLPNENAIGLTGLSRIVDRFADSPLDARQSARVGRHVASRFMRVNATEWRAYNQGAVDAAWPHRHDGPRVLIVPSSRNEFFGHDDWRCGWREPTEALDAVMDRLGLKGEHCVLRCHPNWGETIGRASGEMPERYYTEWASRRGITVVPSTDRRSTLSLIAHSDAIVVNGSSAALDAGVLGKQVIATGPGAYQASGHADLVLSPAALDALHLRSGDAESRRIARQALRFGYAIVGRVPQFVDHVRSDTSFDYRYYDGADPQRLATMISTGRLEADDANRSDDGAHEDSLVDAIRSKAWPELLRGGDDHRPVGRPLRIERRPMYRAVDALRRLRPVGDR